MKNKLLGLFTAVLLLTIVFSGCVEDNGVNTQINEMDRFVGKWGEVYFTVKNESVVFGEITFYNNETGKSYYRSPCFSEIFTFKLADNLIDINLTDRFFIADDGNETPIVKCKYNFSDKDTILTLTGLNNDEYSCILLKDYNLSSTSEIEGGNWINMTVSETLFAVENVTSFNLTIYNPLFASMSIHECFSLVNETSHFIGRFKKEGYIFIIDLENLSEDVVYCNDVILNPYEKRTYKFKIENAEEGTYKIDMNKAIMNLWSFAQGFAKSNDFTIVTN